MSRETKWRCVDCGLIHTGADRPQAPSPFEASHILDACPDCKGVNNPERLCDESGCNEIAGCGTPFGDGRYKFHCHKHPPAQRDKE